MEEKRLKVLIKFLVLTLLSMQLFSCFFKPKSIFEDQEIKLLAHEDSIVPSLYYNLDFFGKGDDNNVVKLEYLELKEVYQSQFNNLDYEDYLFKLLNQEIFINTDNKVFFKLNDTIYKVYRNSDFDDFLSFYCKKDKNGRCQVNKILSLNELNTLSYFLFINGYFVTFDDYIGTYYIIHKTNIFR